jgi:nitroreductase
MDDGGNIMEVNAAIDERRTTRAFGQKASEEQVKKLLLAGAKAPSGSNVQPWEFIIIDDPQIIEQIAEHKYQQTLKHLFDDMLLKQPEAIEHIFQKALQQSQFVKSAERQRNAYNNCDVIAVCNQKGHGIGRKPWMNVENIASTWMCIENMALAATADGLGMQISILREEHKVAVEKLLGIPDDYELATMVMVGVPAEVRQTKEFRGTRPDFSWLHRNRFGARS